MPSNWQGLELSDQLQWYMGVSKNNGTPKSSILKGFSIIFTIHFGGFSPYFWFNTHIYYNHFRPLLVCPIFFSVSNSNSTIFVQLPFIKPSNPSEPSTQLGHFDLRLWLSFRCNKKLWVPLICWKFRFIWKSVGFFAHRFDRNDGGKHRKHQVVFRCSPIFCAFFFSLRFQSCKNQKKTAANKKMFGSRYRKLHIPIQVLKKIKTTSHDENKSLYIPDNSSITYTNYKKKFNHMLQNLVVYLHCGYLGSLTIWTSCGAQAKGWICRFHVSQCLYNCA